MSQITQATKIKILQYCQTPRHWYEIIEYIDKANTTTISQLKNLQYAGLILKTNMHYKTTKKGLEWKAKTIKDLKLELGFIIEMERKK